MSLTRAPPLYASAPRSTPRAPRLAGQKREAAARRLSDKHRAASDVLADLAAASHARLASASAALAAAIDGASEALVDGATCEASRQVLRRMADAHSRRTAAIVQLKDGVRGLASTPAAQLLRAGVPSLVKAIDGAITARVPSAVVRAAQSQYEEALAFATLDVASSYALAALATFRQMHEEAPLELARRPLATAVQALAGAEEMAAVAGAGFAVDAETSALEKGRRLLASVTSALERRQAALDRLSVAKDAAHYHLPPSAHMKTANGTVVCRLVNLDALKAAVLELDAAASSARKAYVPEAVYKEAIVVLTVARAAAKELHRQQQQRS